MNVSVDPSPLKADWKYEAKFPVTATEITKVAQIQMGPYKSGFDFRTSVKNDRLGNGIIAATTRCWKVIILGDDIIETCARYRS